MTVLYDQSAAWRVLGNLLVAAAALVIHCAAVVAVRLYDGSLTIAEAAAKCRFPEISHRVFLLCFQGLMLESLRGVVRHSNDTFALVVSCVGLFFCVCVPAVVAVQCTRAGQEVAYSPFLVALTKYPKFVRAPALPRGWWSRREDVARRWGPMFFFAAGPSRAVCCLLPYVRPTATSLAAVFVEVPCTRRMVFLGSVHALLVALVFVLRSHRVGLAGCASVVMDALLVCIIALTLAPQSEGTSRGIPWLMSTMGIASIMFVVCQTALALLERRWVHHEENASAAHGALNVPLQDALGDEDGNRSSARVAHRTSSNPLHEMMSVSGDGIISNCQR